jgi:hypothetical protein
MKTYGYIVKLNRKAQADKDFNSCPYAGTVYKEIAGVTYTCSPDGTFYCTDEIEPGLEDAMRVDILLDNDETGEYEMVSSRDIPLTYDLEVDYKNYKEFVMSIINNLPHK